MQEKKEKINVSRKMKTLEIGENFILPKSEYRLSSVRVMANILKNDTGLEFMVSLRDEKIGVTRIK